LSYISKGCQIFKIYQLNLRDEITKGVLLE
jgi:hypothetical protein